MTFNVMHVYHEPFKLSSDTGTLLKLLGVQAQQCGQQNIFNAVLNNPEQVVPFLLCTFKLSIVVHYIPSCKQTTKLDSGF